MIKADGQFKVVDTSAEPLEPVPFPKGRDKAGWEAFVSSHFEGWGKRWGKVKGGPDVPTMFSQREAPKEEAPAP